ncbi:uncharacterized protein LOC142229697 [Haematobia irritans]|uniref:uncharacterized protein LOC142229697 n=1 Tax=Haematobia irritans TaxID=7368 RepID=UPI003F4F8072
MWVRWDNITQMSKVHGKLASEHDEDWANMFETGIDPVVLQQNSTILNTDNDFSKRFLTSNNFPSGNVVISNSTNLSNVEHNTSRLENSHNDGRDMTKSTIEKNGNGYHIENRNSKGTNILTGKSDTDAGSLKNTIFPSGDKNPHIVGGGFVCIHHVVVGAHQ